MPMTLTMVPVVSARIVVPFHDHRGRRGMDAGGGLERRHDTTGERQAACDDEKECLHAAINAGRRIRQGAKS
jgi:hypothetical protein